MKGIFLYVTAGKGHQVPAEALRDAMRSLGHEAESYDMFDMLGMPLTKKMIEKIWQTSLHHPSQERVQDKLADTKLNSTLMTMIMSTIPKASDKFLDFVDHEKPDFILGTHYFISPIIVPFVHSLGFHIPVYAYAPDIFFFPHIGVSKQLDRLYVCSDLGMEWCLEQGFTTSQVTLCPFPLKQSIENFKPLSKTEARAKIGLEDRFTILLNLGGEGIGNTKLVTALAEDGYEGQVVVVGRMSGDTAAKYAEFKERHPSFHLFTPGFVSNMSEYICACDVQVGKTGANSLMESFYLKRPFVITEQLYTSERTELFFDKHSVGWTENDVDKQVKLLERISTDKELQKSTKVAFDGLDLPFGSKKFVRQIIGDTKLWYDTH